MIKTVHSKNAPSVIGSYSQAMAVDNFIFCSGQIGIDPKSGELVEGVENQTRQIIKNIEAVLEAVDSSLDHVVKATIFLVNMGDFAVVNKIYGEYFSVHKPARSTVGVSALPKGALVEIEVVAVRNK